MSAEMELREELETLFDPYDWHDGDGNAYAPTKYTAQAVLDIFKRGRYLVADGRIYRVQAADWDDAIDGPHFRVHIDGDPG